MDKSILDYLEWCREKSLKYYYYDNLVRYMNEKEI